VYQLIGEVIALAFKLPIPGPVIGMLLLFLTLVARGKRLGRTAQYRQRPALAPVAAVRARRHRRDGAS